MPVEVDYASEYRYRDPIVDATVLVARHHAVGRDRRHAGGDGGGAASAARGSIAICNVLGSQATRISEGVVYTHAGPEIGVASTKAFTTQLVALYLLRPLPAPAARRWAIEPSSAREPGAPAAGRRRSARRSSSASRSWRGAISAPTNFLFLGRGINYPIALEGALKLKEISYIHAEGYPAGEMKHGPIALIDENMPVVVVATGRARLREDDEQHAGGQGARRRGDRGHRPRRRTSSTASPTSVVQVPRLAEHLQPIVNVVPLQLLAYHIGVRRGADVDQPRNLAKSVTVE